VTENGGYEAIGLTPYYADDLVTLYNADCREIAPALDPVDLLLTDPPYGIAGVWKGGSSGKHGWGKAGADAVARNEWDHETPDADTFALLLAKARHAVIWGGNYFPLPLSRGWLVWNKPERNFTLAEAELAWTNRDAVIRVRDLPRSDVGREHPTQKPLSLMRWCLTFFPDAKTVLDPFSGSGTTLRAAKDMGLRAVGVEIDERYCEMAARRLSQEVLTFEEAPDVA
jgi:site-specific DNA-methyltransferase (adenine-specific)